MALCEFTFPPAQILVRKIVINNYLGNLTSSDFNIHVEGENPSITDLTGNPDGVLLTMEPGEYEVTEDPVEGYTSRCENCTGDLTGGDYVVVTITNTDIFSPGCSFSFAGPGGPTEACPIIICPPHAHMSVTRPVAIFVCNGNSFVAAQWVYTPPEVNMLELYRGDSAPIEGWVEGDDGALYGLTNAALYFSLKRSFSDSDADAVLYKTSGLGGGITLQPSGLGTFSIAIEAGDTLSMQDRKVSLFYELKLKDSANKIYTVGYGDAIVYPSVRKTAIT